MIKSDYHLHTSASFDSDTDMELMTEKAIALGLEEIAFTDHQDYLPDGGLYPFNIDFDEYILKFNNVKEKYKNRIKLVLGVELGMMPHFSDIIGDFAESYPFEFIIGSSHDTSKISHFAGKFFDGKKKEQAYTEYFVELLEEIKILSDHFDVLGHIDYIARYGVYDDNRLLYKDYRDVIDQVLRALIERGKGIEINTSGIRYGLGVLHPQFDILKRYRELGGEIVTVGSDAHHPDHVWDSFDLAAEQLKSAGFKAYTQFRERKPIFIKL